MPDSPRPSDPERVCPECGSDDPARTHLGQGQSTPFVGQVEKIGYCPDSFHGRNTFQPATPSGFHSKDEAKVGDNDEAREAGSRVLDAAQPNTPERPEGEDERPQLSVYELPGVGWGASCCGGTHKFEARTAAEAQRTCEVIHLRAALATAESELRQSQEEYHAQKTMRKRLAHRADAAEAQLDQAREALRFYAKQRGLGSVLASDGGMKARKALSLLKTPPEGEKDG